MMHTYINLSVMFFMQESLKGVQLYTSYLEESERKAGQSQLGDTNEAEPNFQHCRSINTAICIDAANFWSKSKIANPKAVKMNLTTWLQLLLGCCYRNWEILHCDGSITTTWAYPYHYPSDPSAAPYAMSPNQRPPVLLVDLTVNITPPGSAEVSQPQSEFLALGTSCITTD